MSNPPSSDLPYLPDIAVLSPYVTRILGQNPSPFTLQGTNTYLVGAPSQNKRVLIDSGQGLESYAKLLKMYVDVVGLEIAGIIITHWHHDHCDGAESICKVLGYRPPIMKIESPSTGMPSEFWKILQDNETVQLAGVELQVMHTPGHCDDHASIWMSGQGLKEPGLFSGDNILGHGTTFFQDYSAYMTSLHRIKTIPGLTKIYPGHGQLINDGPAKVNEYILHRAKRETEVLRILRSSQGGLTSEEVTRQLYGDKSAKILEAANRGVQQYLLKLINDGTASSEEGVYRSRCKSKI